jgi:hypothetical protein
MNGKQERGRATMSTQLEETWAGALDNELGRLRALATPPEGLEARVLEGVHRRLAAAEARRSRWPLGFVGWAPVAAAGCAACLLAGALAVERDTLGVRPSPDSAAVLAGNPASLLAPAPAGSLATAGAERSVAAPLAVGHRRGRAVHSRAALAPVRH